MPEPERLQLEGTKITDTDTLMLMVNNAAQEGFEYQLSEQDIKRLDPDGTHIVCLRPHLIPGAERSDDQHGYVPVKMDITMGTPLPCEILIKPKGTMKMFQRMLSIPTMFYMELPDVPPEHQARTRLPRDGQRRQRAT